jgi:hypothetical protein
MGGVQNDASTVWNKLQALIYTGSMELTPAQLEAQKKRDQVTEARLSGIEMERQAQLRQLNINQATNEGIGQASLGDTQAELQQARAEWQKALAEAAAARATAEKEGPAALKLPNLNLEGLDDIIMNTKKKVDVVGTFNPLASIGSDSLSERTANATEQVAANTKKLIQQGRQAGLAFS